MAQIIGLPKLSPTMEEGVLVKWVKKEGDSVEPGDLVAEVETDKANMDFNLEDEGFLLKLLVQEGDTVKLGAPVAILGDKGEDITALEKEAEQQITGGGAPPAAAPEPAPAPQPAAPAAAPAPAAPAPAAAPAAPPAPAPAAGGRILASPLAKTLALELGIDLRTLAGTGPGGRIVERDVKAAAEGGATAPAPAAAPAAAAAPASTTALAVVPPKPLAVPTPEGDFEDRPLSGMRKAIARRLTESKQTIPHFYLTTSFDAGKLLEFRKALNKLVPDNKISVNDLIIKGTALALRRVPACNAAFLGDAIRYFSRIHIGVAVAVDDGLVTPVIRDADIKGIGGISREVKDLATRARDKQLKGHEIQGSTFSISNLGMFGIEHFEAVINPPEGGILAVGTIKKVPAVIDDRIGVRDEMKLTMSCDHRVIDGALGARFLQELVKILEQPELLSL